MFFSRQRSRYRFSRDQTLLFVKAAKIFSVATHRKKYIFYYRYFQCNDNVI